MPWRIGVVLGALIALPAFSQTLGEFPQGVFDNTAAIEGTPPAASGMKTPILALASPSATNPTTAGAANYYGFINGSAIAATSTLSLHQGVMPVAGTLSALNVDVNTSPGGAATWTASAVYNGSVSTALQCVIAAGTAPGFGTGSACASGALSVVVGDLVAWDMVAAGTPSALTTPFQLSALFQATSGQHSPIVGIGNANMSTSALQYLGLGQSAGLQTTEYIASVVFPTGGTLNSMTVALNGGAPGAGAAVTVNVVQNGTWANTSGVSTGLECQISGASATKCLPAANTGAAITVSAGDTISVQLCPSTSSGGPITGCPTDSGATGGGWTAVPTARGITVGFDWTPTTANYAVVFSNMGTAPATASNVYFNSSGNITNEGTEVYGENVTPNGTTVTLEGYYVNQCPGPGASRTRTTQPRSAAGNVGTTVAFTNNATACPTMNAGNGSWSATTVATNGFFDFETLPTGGTNTAVTMLKVGSSVTSP